MNFAILISLFTQLIKFSDGQLILPRSSGPLGFLSGSIAGACLSNGAFEEPPPLVAFRIWGMMQVIDFFSFSLLRGCYCIFSQCVSAQRLSIVSRCDQTWRSIGALLSRPLNPRLSPGCLTGEQLHCKENMAGGLCFLLSRLPSTLQSSILFSPAQSCSVVHECQLSAASSLSPSLPLLLTLPRSLSLLFLPISLSLPQFA